MHRRSASRTLIHDPRCLGLAFKANIDDFRESPALKVASALAERYGERVRIVEPYAAFLPDTLQQAGAKLIDIDTAIDLKLAEFLLAENRRTQSQINCGSS